MEFEVITSIDVINRTRPSPFENGKWVIFYFFIFHIFFIILDVPYVRNEHLILTEA